MSLSKISSCVDEPCNSLVLDQMCKVLVERAAVSKRLLLGPFRTCITSRPVAVQSHITGPRDVLWKPWIEDLTMLIWTS